MVLWGAGPKETLFPRKPINKILVEFCALPAARTVNLLIPPVCCIINFICQPLSNYLKSTIGVAHEMGVLCG